LAESRTAGFISFVFVFVFVPVFLFPRSGIARKFPNDWKTDKDMALSENLPVYCASYDFLMD